MLMLRLLSWSSPPPCPGARASGGPRTQCWRSWRWCCRGGTGRPGSLTIHMCYGIRWTYTFWFSPLRKRSLARRRLSRAWGAGAGDGAGAASVGESRRHANTADRARMTDCKQKMKNGVKMSSTVLRTHQELHGAGYICCAEDRRPTDPWHPGLHIYSHEPRLSPRHEWVSARGRGLFGSDREQRGSHGSLSSAVCCDVCASPGYLRASVRFQKCRARAKTRKEDQ